MEENNGIIEEFVLNQNGVQIKKCCASCATHEPYDENATRRLCTFRHCNKVVRKDDLCDNWTMSDAINRIRVRGQGL